MIVQALFFFLKHWRNKCQKIHRWCCKSVPSVKKKKCWQVTQVLYFWSKKKKITLSVSKQSNCGVFHFWWGDSLPLHFRVKVWIRLVWVRQVVATVMVRPSLQETKKVRKMSDLMEVWACGWFEVVTVSASNVTDVGTKRSFVGFWWCLVAPASSH